MLKRQIYPHNISFTSKLYAKEGYVMLTVHDQSTGETFQTCWYWNAGAVKPDSVEHTDSKSEEDTQDDKD